MKIILGALSLFVISTPLSHWAKANDPNTTQSARSASTEASAGRTCQTSHFGYCPSNTNVALSAQTGKLPLLPFPREADKDKKPGGSDEAER